jgi:uncharacterized protein YggU (UPF0235/DUF167 family)
MASLRSVMRREARLSARGEVAQSVEHTAENRGVAGSIPALATLRLLVILTPGASSNTIVGRHGDGWKVRVAAAPERGRANAALVALLAETLGVPLAAIRVAAGQTHRRKVIEIDGLDEEEAGRRLDAARR